MGKVDKAKLVRNRPRVDDGVVSIDGVGDFRIRPLTRAEALRVHELQNGDGLVEAEVFLVACGLTEPTFTPDEVREWMEAPGSSAEISPISQAIGIISGLTVDAGKNAYKSPGRRSDGA